jgi:hypothetical protein
LHVTILWVLLRFNYPPQSMRQLVRTVRVPGQPDPWGGQAQPATRAQPYLGCAQGQLQLQDSEISPASKMTFYFAVVLVLIFCIQLAFRSLNTETKQLLQWGLWILEILLAYTIAQSLYDSAQTQLSSAQPVSILPQPQVRSRLNNNYRNRNNYRNNSRTNNALIDLLTHSGHGHGHGHR